MGRLFIFKLMVINQLYQSYLKSNKVSTDSRAIEKGDMFFALKGPNFNANKFTKEVLDKGAAFVVIDDSDYNIDDRCILVNDVLKTLQDLSAFHRRKLAVPVIAIAGSNGKTTTKELMASVLSKSYKTYYTKGNYNNEIGLPLTLLSIKNDAEIIILEMGARKRNDIAFLCEIAQPTHGLITNIGKDHIEFFGTVENTLLANAELFSFLIKSSGVIFVNPEHKEIYEQTKGGDKVVTYGAVKGMDYFGKIEESYPFVNFSFLINEGWYKCKTNLVGTYNFENLMAAVSVGDFFSVLPRKICEAIQDYKPDNNRSQLIKYDSNNVILDAYNANPSSMKLALESFDLIEHPKKMLILGDMLELGAISQEEHLLTILQIKKMKLDKIILVGEEFGKLKNKLDCLYFENYKQLKNWFNQHIPQQYLILVKGSRGISLEKVFVN